MPVEERRESILDATMPLLMDFGADVTTRQIADAAGIAEGTVFRAFADKQELISAAVARFMDPEPTLELLRAVDATLPLEHKVRAVVEIVSGRFCGVVGVMHALGIHHDPPPGVDHHHAHSSAAVASRDVTARLFEPDADSLRMDPAEAVHFIKLLCFANTVPPIVGERHLSPEALTDFILRGIAKEGH